MDFALQNIKFFSWNVLTGICFIFQCSITSSTVCITFLSKICIFIPIENQAFLSLIFTLWIQWHTTFLKKLNTFLPYIHTAYLRHPPECLKQLFQFTVLSWQKVKFNANARSVFPVDRKIYLPAGVRNIYHIIYLPSVNVFIQWKYCTSFTPTNAFFLQPPHAFFRVTFKRLPRRRSRHMLFYSQHHHTRGPIAFSCHKNQ